MPTANTSLKGTGQLELQASIANMDAVSSYAPKDSPTSSTDNVSVVSDVRGVIPLHAKKESSVFNWKTELGLRRNYGRLAKRLAKVNQFLFRNGSNGHGLSQVLPNGHCRLITTAAQFMPILVDCLPMLVTKQGKFIAEMPAMNHLNAMLRAEAFLRKFRSVDHVANTPMYRDDFTLLKPGYDDGGDGRRFYYAGPVPTIADSIETISPFLDVMDFASDADRTNTVAAALTVHLRHHWPGQKPLFLVTASKSQAGKGTIVEFIRGRCAKADLLYESIDWPMQSQLQRQINQSPDLGMICLDNVRLDSAGGRARCIRSAFIESFVTNPEITLACSGGGEPVRLQNWLVTVINTNDGLLSADLMNRALPIHLTPKGDVHDRETPIGNPKLEFLPQNQERIEAELRGMIERWQKAGCPLDETAKHPMTHWAQTIGGILRHRGFSNFLANYQAHRAVDDPIGQALGILAAAKPGQELRPHEWADLALEQGLAKTLFSTYERDTEKGRERAIGVLFSRHTEETIEVHTDSKRLRVRLEGGFRRWIKGQNPHTRYVFHVLEEEPFTVTE